MMASIRAHFDGKVFVPDEPVALPANAPVRLVLLSDLDQSGEADEFSALADSGLSFWDNEVDDGVWNDASPPA